MRTRKIIKFGNSMGITFPKDILCHLNWKPGDKVIIKDDIDAIIIKKISASMTNQNIDQKWRIYLRNLHLIILQLNYKIYNLYKFYLKLVWRFFNGIIYYINLFDLFNLKFNLLFSKIYRKGETNY